MQMFIFIKIVGSRACKCTKNEETDSRNMFPIGSFSVSTWEAVFS